MNEQGKYGPEFPVKRVIFKAYAAKALGSVKGISSGDPVSRVGIRAGTVFTVVFVPALAAVVVRGAPKGEEFLYHVSLIDEIVLQGEEPPTAEIGTISDQTAVADPRAVAKGPLPPLDGAPSPDAPQGFYGGATDTPASTLPSSASPAARRRAAAR